MVCGRFKGHVDRESGYVYFFDSVTAETSWYKPKLCCASIFLLTVSKSKKDKSASPNNGEAGSSSSSGSDLMRTVGAITPRGFPRQHRSADGRTDETGFRVSYSFCADLGFKSRKLKFSPEKKEKTEEDGRNDKYLSKPYVAPVVRPETPPDLESANLQDQSFALVILWLDNQVFLSFTTLLDALLFILVYLTLYTHIFPFPLSLTCSRAFFSLGA